MEIIKVETDLAAPIERVWRAISDYREFGTWFRVKLTGPFKVDATARGNITYPGYEHMKWEAEIQEIEPPNLFSFTWHPYAVDPKVDYSKEDPTVVEFSLKKTASGTHLTITESGFEQIPESRRAEAFKMNQGGWEEQIKNIRAHLNSTTSSSS